MVTVSKKAEEQLRQQLLSKCLQSGIGFRILINHDNTFSLKLDRQNAGDRVMNSGHIKVFWDPSNDTQIGSCQLDYEEEPSSGFFLK